MVGSDIAKVNSSDGRYEEFPLVSRCGSIDFWTFPISYLQFPRFGGQQ